MSFRIIGDSCLDLTDDLKQNPQYQMVPLTLQVDDHMVLDDENFDQLAFIRMVKASPNCIKTACPSPDAFKTAYTCEEDDVYVITLSSHLSGTYNSAVLGKELYEEEFGKGHKNILVIDSESASSGELNLALGIRDMYADGFEFAEISKRILAKRDAQKTYFVIDSLEPLRKNGRLTGLQAFFATALNIKPVMGAEKGVIVKLDQARGMNKALTRMNDLVMKNAGEMADKRVVIAQCNTPERAAFVRADLEKRGDFREIVMTETAGVATAYAGDGGIILCVE